MSGRFQPRPIRPTGVHRTGGWRLKQYEITLDGEPIAAEIISAVHDVLRATVPEVPDGQPGVGFVIIHQGTEAIWLLIDLWTDDILSQHTFCAPLDDLTSFARVPAGGPTACAWELPVHSHERDALVAHILDPAPGPNVDAYLADTVRSGNRSSRETDLLIRDVPDEVVAAIDAKAQCLGLSRSDYLRRALVRERATTDRV